MSSNLLDEDDHIYELIAHQLQEEMELNMDGAASPSNRAASTADGEASTAGGEASTADGEASPADGEASTADSEASTADGEASTTDGSVPLAHGVGSSSSPAVAGPNTCGKCGQSLALPCAILTRVVCDHCLWGRTQGCNYCQGSGVLWFPDGRQQDCDRCLATGEVTICTQCQGARGHRRNNVWENCKTCKGRGQYTCIVCEGEGAKWMPSVFCAGDTVADEGSHAGVRHRWHPSAQNFPRDQWSRTRDHSEGQ